jgi:hypothetical protein
VSFTLRPGRGRASAAGLALALALAALPGAASAAACCMSAASFGVGRLKIWEDWAAGAQVGHARSIGQYGADGALRRYGSDLADGLTRIEPWAIVRLSERLQVQAWVPVLLNDRRVGGQGQLAGGLGDVGAALRTEVVALGQYAGLPSLAFTVGALAPTGRRPEDTSLPLFAGATGRGTWGASLAVESEYAFLPWFVRADAGFTWLAPFTRSDGGVRQQYAPQLAAALSAGREVLPERLVLALALSGEWEGALQLDGGDVPASSARSLTLAASAAYALDPRWTVVGVVSNGLWPAGAAANRDARLGFTLGIRHGHF